ncbi:MAG TPA: hypothetical protein PK850_08400 [Ignavibacteria bacterium]|nr:hypothetical protein [Bacteroidota bacterium]HRE10791.1 hypothetical protein [Ignavibacteria bacterium]HRF65966.1 hypothetical protein [Ignavibacteria bacterium]HRJ84365.1 hypothetical protein [Ignavibacteria bacterium]
MICPLCKYPKTTVENTLKFISANRRLRQCANPNCRKYFFTQETVLPGMLFDETPIDDKTPPEDDGEEKEPDLFSKN